MTEEYQQQRGRERKKTTSTKTHTQPARQAGREPGASGAPAHADSGARCQGADERRAATETKWLPGADRRKSPRSARAEDAKRSQRAAGFPNRAGGL